MISTNKLLLHHLLHSQRLVRLRSERAVVVVARRCRRAFGSSSSSRSSTSSSLPRVIPTKGVPIHLYCSNNEHDDIEPDALQQVRVLAESPLPTDFVAVMPDAHLGKGVTIGTVFASEKYVCPNAVGVDIGCGMAAIPIHNLVRGDLTNAQKNTIQQRLKERIPTGFAQHQKPLPGTARTLDDISGQIAPTEYVKEQLLLGGGSSSRKKEASRLQQQLGTLGGGNHFLEVVYDDDDDTATEQQVWCLLHSGSRNIGNRTAQHYDQLARHWLEREQGVERTRALRGIHYLPIESPEGQDYLRDMEWCQKYAFCNRQAMQNIMLEIMHEVTGHEAELDRAVNIHHNYCQCETCADGRALWITRKGATSAQPGEYGIIPGSMGTKTYITRGKGDPASWNSSSHGAGRRMSRTAAHHEIAQTDFEASMRGVVCDVHPGVRDEAPQAYKNLDHVMQQQESLTEIVCKLRPLINVKGFEKKIPKKYRKRRKML